MRHLLTYIFSMVLMNCLSQNISDTILPKQRSLASEKKVPWQWIAPATLTGLGIWGSIDKNLRKRKPEYFDVRQRRPIR